jgi:hypothetical protein
VPHATKDRGSFWWRDLLKLCDIYRGIAKCSVGDGSTALFWSDIWNDHILQDKFPRLFSFAKDNLISVARFLSTKQMDKFFHLPLSSEAWHEYQALQVIIQGIQIACEEKDCWTYIWRKSEYSSSKFYNLHFSSLQPPKPFIWIWDSKCLIKIRVFGWLLLMDRLNVRNILRGKNCRLEGNDYSCVLCRNNREGTTFHLFFLCPFRCECWRSLHIIWDFNLDFFSMMDDARNKFQNGFFMETFLIGTWLIWKQMNAFIFNRGSPSHHSWKAGFLKDAHLQSVRISDVKKIAFSSFLASLA